MTRKDIDFTEVVPGGMLSIEDIMKGRRPKYGSTLDAVYRRWRFPDDRGTGSIRAFLEKKVSHSLWSKDVGAVLQQFWDSEERGDNKPMVSSDKWNRWEESGRRFDNGVKDYRRCGWVSSTPLLRYDCTSSRELVEIIARCHQYNSEIVSRRCPFGPVKFLPSKAVEEIFAVSCIQAAWRSARTRTILGKLKKNLKKKFGYLARCEGKFCI